MHVKSGRAARCCEHQALCVSAQPHQLDLTVNLKVFFFIFLLLLLCLIVEKEEPEPTLSLHVDLNKEVCAYEDTLC